MKKWSKLLISAAGLELIWLGLLRPRLVNWGSSTAERDMRLPGDYIIGDKLQWTRAVTIFRPVEEVWPWIAQWGRGGGYYVWDYLMNGNRPSANYILDLPEPAAGESGSKMGRIVQVEPGRSIVWLAEGLYPCFGSSLDACTEMIVEPVGLGATRLTQRIRLDWHGWTGILKAHFIEPADALLNRKILKRIKQLAETWEARQAEGTINNNILGGHQAQDIAYVSANTGETQE